MSLLLMLTSSVKVLAQSKPKAGDTISGVVTDSVSPLMAVYITELDSADRAVAYAYTDLKGEFSFSLVNPKDRIQFSYYRKEKIVLPIDKAYFEIRMEDDKDLPPIDWEDFAPLDSRDVQDAAKAPVLIDISEYESLGLYTIDDIFNAKMGLDLPWFDDTDIIHPSRPPVIPPKCNARIGPVRLVGGVDVGHTPLDEGMLHTHLR